MQMYSNSKHRDIRVKHAMRCKIQNKSWQIDPDTGFLTITVSLLNDKPMAYNASELHLEGDDTYLMSASYHEMSAGIDTLAGVPVVVGHTWQTVDTISKSVGHIKGNINLDDTTNTITCDVLITDADTILRIVSGELIEISSAYKCDLNYINDREGTQHALDFNHLALLGKGEGRGGDSIRILNHNKQETQMATDAKTELTRVRLQNGKDVYVANESVDDVQDMDKKVENMIDDDKFKAKVDELKAAREQVSRLEGEMAALKEKLEAAMSPEMVETAAAEMVENEEAADRIMNSRNLKRDEIKRHGHDLKSYVVQQVQIANSKKLTDGQLADESFVSGMFSVYASEQHKTVSVSNAVQMQNSSVNQMTDQQRYLNSLQK